MKPSTPTKIALGPFSSSPTSSLKRKPQTKVKKLNASPKGKGKKASANSNANSNQTVAIGSSANVNLNQQLTVQANLSHLMSSPEYASPNSSNSDKKTYIGLSANTVRCVWEQYDSNETEINPDVLPVLAEDASYRLWELGNNLKTFTRHSGGKLTTDIVNEVLKDCNAMPVIGARAGSTEWSPVDYDGTYYFHEDEIIDLRDDYLKDISSIQCGPMSLECDWVPSQRCSKDLTKLWKSIMLAVIMGDDIAFQYTIHSTLINPHVGCILAHLLQKTVEYLSFGCSEDTLDRLLHFLKVIVQNYHCRDVINNEEHFNLANVFVSLLLGPVDIKARLEKIKTEQVQREKKETEIGTTKLVNGGSSIRVNGVDIKDEYDTGSNDAYSKFVVNPLAMNIKKEINSYDYEQNIKFEPNFYDMDFQDDAIFDYEASNIKIDANPETELKVKVEEGATITECFSSFETSICNDRYVDVLSDLIGSMASKWGYFEYEIIYLLTKRLEIFFYEITTWTCAEYQWILRAIRVLSALGEVAFRELTVYFAQIPYDDLPPWILPNLNFAAIYIRGKKDKYFYEYMQEVCADGIIPFMTFYSDYMKKLQEKALAAEKARKTPTKIPTKFQLRVGPRPSLEYVVTLDEMFPERTRKAILPVSRRIGFRFAGCCPVPPRPRKSLTIVPPVQQSTELRNSFNQRYVIGRGKMLKPIFINGGQRIEYSMDYRWINL